MELKKHLLIRIYGRVQGVGYRYSALRKARQLGLKGFVRNRPDGSVLVEAEGEEWQVDRMLEWCKTGPARARVESVETETLPPGEFSGFEIR